MPRLLGCLYSVHSPLCADGPRMSLSLPPFFVLRRRGTGRSLEIFHHDNVYIMKRDSLRRCTVYWLSKMKSTWCLKTFLTLSTIAVMNVHRIINKKLTPTVALLVWRIYVWLQRTPRKSAFVKLPLIKINGQSPRRDYTHREDRILSTGPSIVYIGSYYISELLSGLADCLRLLWPQKDKTKFRRLGNSRA